MKQLKKSIAARNTKPADRDAFHIKEDDTKEIRLLTAIAKYVTFSPELTKVEWLGQGPFGDDMGVGGRDVGGNEAAGVLREAQGVGIATLLRKVRNFRE